MAREEERFECLSSSYPIMIINMNGKGAADERRKLIISIIKDSSASVIFCQEAIGYFKKKVVEECCNDDHSYKFVPEAVTSNKGQAVVMWCETDFQGEEVRLTDSSITKFVKRLWNEKYVLSVSEVRIRTALVKLTRKTTGASFLAVSWHGPRGGNKETKQKTLHGLICFLREVCEEEKLSSFIIGGDFNLNTSSPDQVDLTKYKGITISSYELCSRDKEQRGQSFVRYKDTFIVSVTVPPDEHSMTGDITVSLVTPRDFEKKANENALLDHVPVVGTLKLVLPDKRFSKQDRGKLEQHFQARTFRSTSFVYQSCDYGQTIFKGCCYTFEFQFHFPASSRYSRVRKHRHISTFQ